MSVEISHQPSDEQVPVRFEPGDQLDWSVLLDEAMNMPGQMGNTYSRFYQYSFNNQLLLYMQGVLEPVGTYNKWKELGRQVQKGSKAKSILRPITVKLKDELDDQGNPKKITKFKLVKCIFGLSDTEGDDLPEYEPVEWSKERALGNLAIEQVAFELPDGNVAGYSVERRIAVSPVAPYPFKTLMHELGHVVLGHTTQPHREPTGTPSIDYMNRRDVRAINEFQAESTAYLVMKELGTDEQFNASESRAYIQSWLDLRTRKEPIEDKYIKAIFKAVDTILRAGRETPSPEA